MLSERRPSRRRARSARRQRRGGAGRGEGLERAAGRGPGASGPRRPAGGEPSPSAPRSICSGASTSRPRSGFRACARRACGRSRATSPPAIRAWPSSRARRRCRCSTRNATGIVAGVRVASEIAAGVAHAARGRAIAQSREALDAIERLRSSQAGESSRAGLFGNWARDYQWLTGQLLQAQPPRLARGVRGRRTSALARAARTGGPGRRDRAAAPTPLEIEPAAAASASPRHNGDCCQRRSPKPSVAHCSTSCGCWSSNRRT